MEPEGHDGVGAHRRRVIEAVLASGTPYAGSEVDRAGDMLAFAVSVASGADQAVLIVDKAAAELREQSPPSAGSSC